jgi:hypothetical protein
MGSFPTLKWASIALLAGAFACGGNAAVIGLSPEDSLRLENLHAATEAAATTNAMLIDAFGQIVSQRITFNGTFDTSGWTLTIGGSYAGMALDLSFTGVFDDATGSGAFTSTGTIGSSSWDGTGTWGFTEVDPETVDFRLDQDVSISALAFRPDIRGTWVWRYVDTPTAVLSSNVGVVQKTRNGRPWGRPRLERSGDRIPKMPPRTGGSITVGIDDGSDLTATFDFDAGTISGNVHTIPEPATMALVGLCALGLIARARWRRRPGHG